MAPAKKDSPLTLACILITILLDMVGYGIIVPVIVSFILVEAAVIAWLQFRKMKSSDPEVWDWWADEIKE